LNTLPWMRSVFNELAREYGVREVDMRDYERYRDLHGRALLRELKLPIWKLPQVVSGMRKRMSQHAGQFSLFSGMNDVLEQLADSQMQLAIVSSNSRQNVERVLGPDNVKRIRHFACEVSMFGKAAKLKTVLKASAVGREEAIYIGDEIRDAEAAQKVGIAFGGVGWGQHSEKALRAQKPAHFFASVPEIAASLC
jgi:phosphoglycolate phosphatase